MSKRTADPAWGVEIEGEGQDGKPLSRKRTAGRPRGPPKLTPPLYKASIKELAEAATIRVSSSTADIDNAVLQRIKKCLERANHPTTPEGEAKAAFFLASRLMGQHNVSQAEVLAHELPSVQRQYAGQSIVSIQRLDGRKDKVVRHMAYNDILCHAMECFFDCKSYSIADRHSLEFTFYGIADNTVAAAMSLEMAYNLIAEWARPYKGVGSKNSYFLGASNELYKMANKEKAAEVAQAKKKEQDDIAAKIQQEQAERQAELDRLAPLSETANISSVPELAIVADVGEDINSGSAPPQDDASDTTESNLEDIEENSDNDHCDWFDSSDESREGSIEPDFKMEDEINVNTLGDLDEEIRRLIKPEPSSDVSLEMYPPAPPAPSSQSNVPFRPLEREQPPADPTKIEDNPSDAVELEQNQEPESNWASHMQLVAFRATATKIADQYMEDQGVKLRKGAVRSREIRDRVAYYQGVKDSKKIDVYRKRIKE